MNNLKLSTKLSILIFIITFLILTISNYIDETIKYNDSINKLHSNYSKNLLQVKNTIDERIMILSGIFKNLEFVLDKTSNKEYEQKNIEKILFNIFNTKLGLFQMRLLNKNGYEVARINYDGKQKTIVAKNDLQQKAHRYYVKEGFEEKNGKVTYSKLDLNIEKGKIEIPYKATLRLSKRIKIDKEYLLVINVDLNHFLNNSLNNNLYDIFIAEADKQINYHINKELFFSKQLKKEIYFDKYYQHPYKKLPLGIRDYNLIITIKKSQLKFLENNKIRTIQNNIFYGMILSFILSIIFYFLFKTTLAKFEKQINNIIKGESSQFNKKNFPEFEKILENTQHLYNKHQKLKENIHKDYTNKILNSQKNFILVTNGIKLKRSNKAMFKFFGYDSFEDFTKEHDCICDFFIEKKGYLSKIKNDKIWIEHILENCSKDYFVKMKDLSKEIHIFQVNTEGEKVIGDDFVVTFTDITETLKQKETIFEHSKMASMGEMIGNIAHQWRQPLNFISTAASGLKIKYDMNYLEKEDINKFSDAIVKNVQFLSTTIDTFRDFIKGEKITKEIAIQEEIEQAKNIINPVLKNKFIEFIDKINYEENVIINITTGELPQVLINIFNNAKDALIERKINKPFIELNLKKESTKAIITIEDNAGGIPEDVLPHIFEPYFTTKHQSQGTGLGLHISYRIITESLAGKIYVTNTKIGAKFFIEIPL